MEEETRKKKYAALGWS